MNAAEMLRFTQNHLISSLEYGRKIRLKQIVRFWFSAVKKSVSKRSYKIFEIFQIELYFNISEVL